MYVTYYEKEINLSFSQKQEAIELYVKWCEDNNAGEPEVTCTDELDEESLLTHVLYHLEMLKKEEQPEWLSNAVGSDKIEILNYLDDGEAIELSECEIKRAERQENQEKESVKEEVVPVESKPTKKKPARKKPKLRK